MPTFKYQAVTADGKATKGTLDAENLDDAGAMLRAQGLFLNLSFLTRLASGERRASLMPALLKPNARSRFLWGASLRKS